MEGQTRVTCGTVLRESKIEMSLIKNGRANEEEKFVLQKQYESFEKLQTDAKKYMDSENQVFVKRGDTRLLTAKHVPADTTEDFEQLKQKFVYKCVHYVCKFGPKRPRGKENFGIRKFSTYKKNCQASFKYKISENFDKLVLVSIIENHCAGHTKSKVRINDFGAHSLLSVNLFF